MTTQRSIASSDKSFIWEDSDFVHVKVPIPKDAKGTLDIDVDVRYVYTLQLGQNFSNHTDTKQVRFKVPVLSTTMRTFRRALSGLAGFGMLVAVWMLVGRFGTRIWERMEHDHDPTAFILIGAVVWIGLGYWWFASKVAIAFGTYSQAMRFVSTLLWLAAPIIMAVVLSRRRKRKHERERVLP